MKNTKPVHAEFISGTYTRYHETLAAAQKSVKDPSNGVEFNGTWFQATFVKLEAGTLATDDDFHVHDLKHEPWEPFATVANMPWAFSDN